MTNATALFRLAKQDFARNNIASQKFFYRIARRCVCLNFSSQSLADKLRPAFCHLESADDAVPDLTICAWAGGQAHGAIDDYHGMQRGNGIAFSDGPIRIAYDLQSCRLEAFDSETGIGLFNVPDSDRMSGWECAAPFLRILHWWASGLGLQFVHGAAVGTSDGAALLVGRGGSGKSTTALACVGSPLGYLADDYCLLEPGQTPIVHSVFGSGKADDGSIARLPGLRKAFEAAPADPAAKSIIFIRDHAPGSLVLSSPLRAVAVPKITGGKTCWAEPLPRGEALRALAPSTMFQLPGDRAEALSRMGMLLRLLSSWRLFLGDDPAAAAPVLRDIIFREMPTHAY